MNEPRDNTSVSGRTGFAAGAFDPTGRRAPSEPDVLTRASQVSLIGLFALAVLWCAQVAHAVIVPLLLAWTIATIVLPAVVWLQERGIPRIVAVFAVTALLLVAIGTLLALLSAPLAYWLGRATELGLLLKEKLGTVTQPLAFFEELRNAFSAIGSGSGPVLKVEQQPGAAATILSIVTPAVSQFILFVGALIFYLFYQKKLRDTAVCLLKDRDSRLMALHVLSDVDEHMSTFFGTFTLINIGLALATAALTWFVGLPNPLLWGVLAGMFNYVPYLGPGIVTVTLGLVALLTFPTLPEAAVAPLVFLALVTAEGQFITPMLMGRRLELNPFAVFISIAIWTWLWGPIGAFLAVPILIILSATIGHAFPDTKPELPA